MVTSRPSAGELVPVAPSTALVEMKSEDVHSCDAQGKGEIETNLPSILSSTSMGQQGLIRILKVFHVTTCFVEETLLLKILKAVDMQKVSLFKQK